MDTFCATFFETLYEFVVTTSVRVDLMIIIVFDAVTDGADGVD